MLQKNQYRVYFFIFFAVPFSQGVSIYTTQVSREVDFFPSQSEIEECENDFEKCLDFSNYPHELVEKLFNEGHLKKEWFSSDTEQDIYSVGSLKNDDNINGTALCYFNDTVSYPKGGIIENGAFVYIVQSELYRQAVVRTKCWGTIGSDTSCEVGILVDGLENYTYKCVERINIDDGEVLFGINKDGKIIRVSIQKECACFCEYRIKKKRD